MRDLFSALVDRGIAGVQVEQLLRPAHIVPETKDLAALLTEFRRTNQHMAIVVDEYGDLEGIVTLEDLLEEIVGEIEDEFDLPDESIERLDEDAHRSTAPSRSTTSTSSSASAADRGLPHDRRLRLRPARPRPEPGDEVEDDGMRFKVLEVEGSRIPKLAVTFELRREQRDRDDVEREALEAELFDAENVDARFQQGAQRALGARRT